MTLDARRAALWQAMRLGPVWVERASLPPPAAVVPRAPAVPAPGRPPRPAVPAAPVPLRPAAALDDTHLPADERWQALRAEVAACEACAGLARTRTQTVFAAGNPAAAWMLVGEAPGQEEDLRGEPFVGAAGRLLDNMLAAVGRTRSGGADDGVFIANVLKCRPPGNRNPEADEVTRCAPFLHRQIALVQPRVLLLMGRFAVNAVLGIDASIASLRGRVHRYPLGDRSVPVVVSYHPAYLLRNLADKHKAWADLVLTRQAEAAG